VGLLLLLTAGPGEAVVYVDARSPGPVRDGKSWSTAYATISKAISASIGGDIWIKAGVYPEHITLKHCVNLYGGFLGYETSANQRLLGAFPTVIEGGRRRRAIDVPQDAWVTIDGLTIRRGRADVGAGIRCNTGSRVNIRNCIGTAKTLPDGTPVQLSAKAVGCVDGTTVYVQELDRAAGIAVTGPTDLQAGDLLHSIAGTLATDVYGERYLSGASAGLHARGVYAPKPLGVGVAGLEQTAGVLVRAWGVAEGVTPSGFGLVLNGRRVFVRWSGAGVVEGGFACVTGVRTSASELVASWVH
jgi:hypothetical protein